MSSTGVKTIRVSIVSAFVAPDASIRTHRAVFSVDLEEFGTQHGTTFRRLQALLASGHGLRSTDAHAITGRYFDGTSWQPLETPDDLLPALYGALQSQARELNLQVFLTVPGMKAPAPLPAAPIGKAGNQPNVSKEPELVPPVRPPDPSLVAAVADLLQATQEPPAIHRRILPLRAGAAAAMHGISDDDDENEDDLDDEYLDMQDMEPERAPAADVPPAGGFEVPDIMGLGERLVLTTEPHITFNDISCGGDRGEVDVAAGDDAGAEVDNRLLLYWVDSRRGLLGCVDVHAGSITVLVEDLLIPTRVVCVGRRVYLLEEGGVWPRDGRLSYWDRDTGNLHILLTNLMLPAGLHVTPSHDVWFTQQGEAPLPPTIPRSMHRAGSFNAAQELQPPTLVCVVPRSAVDTAVPGMNIHLRDAAVVKLVRPASRSGAVQDICVLADGRVLIAVKAPPSSAELADSSRASGFVEIYQHDSKGMLLPEQVDVMRRLHCVRTLHLDIAQAPPTVLLCGWGGPPEDMSVAVARCRTTALQDLHNIRYGAAQAVTTDLESNVWFCIQRSHGTELRILPSKSEKRSAPFAGAVVAQTVRMSGMHGGHDGRPGSPVRSHSPVRPLSPVASARSIAASVASDKERHARMSSALASESSGHEAAMVLQRAELEAHLAEVAEGVNVQVVLRCRPLFDWERANGAEPMIKCRRNEVEVAQYAAYVQKKSYLFHRVFDPDTEQRTLYEDSVLPVVIKSVEGFNCTVFAYGQTGTGKTFTLEGAMDDSSKAGIIPRSIHTIFEYLQREAESFTVQVSHLEIYNEELSDLLAGKSDGDRESRSTTSRSLWEAARKRGVVLKLVRPASATGGRREEGAPGPAAGSKAAKLRIVKDPVRGVIVDGLTQIEVSSATEIFQILERSIAMRHTNETQMNKHSSRSHAIFTIQITSSRTDHATGDIVMKEGRLNLVDLSGSENLKRSGSVGDRQREASNINQGLLALGRVIKARVEKSPHIPFRDSKLTRLLEESLGGNSLTLMILTVSPNSLDCDETVSTMNYANMAKMIHNRPNRNVKVQRSPSKVGAEPAQENVAAVFGDSPRAFAEPVKPWDASIPIRPRRKDRLSVGAAGAGMDPTKTFHATAVDWIGRHVLIDGRLTVKALAALRDMFSRFDTTGGGVLNAANLRALTSLLDSAAESAEKQLSRNATAQDRGTEAAVTSTSSTLRPRSAMRPKSAVGIRAPAPVSGTHLSFARFLSYCRYKALTQPYFVLHLCVETGYGMTLEPPKSRSAVPIDGEVPADKPTLYLPDKPKLRFDAPPPRRPKPGEDEALAISSAMDPLPDDPDMLSSWLQVPSQIQSSSPTAAAGNPEPAPDNRALRPQSGIRPSSARPGAVTAAAAPVTPIATTAASSAAVRPVSALPTSTATRERPVSAARSRRPVSAHIY